MYFVTFYFKFTIRKKKLLKMHNLLCWNMVSKVILNEMTVIFRANCTFPPLSMGQFQSPHLSIELSNVPLYFIKLCNLPQTSIFLLSTRPGKRVGSIGFGFDPCGFGSNGFGSKKRVVLNGLNNL